MKNLEVTWDDYIRENKSRFFWARFERLAQSPEGQRRIRNRPRDPEKQALLMDLDEQRWRRMIASGELRQAGPRHWVWR